MGDNRQYKQQFGDLYFLRLAKLKPAVVKVAVEAWEGYNVRQFPLRRGMKSSLAATSVICALPLDNDRNLPPEKKCH